MAVLQTRRRTTEPQVLKCIRRGMTDLAYFLVLNDYCIAM